MANAGNAKNFSSNNDRKTSPKTAKRLAASRWREWRFVAALVFMTGFAFVGAYLLLQSHAETVKCDRNAQYVPSCGVLWGAYSYNGIPAFESLVGRQMDIYQVYHDMSTTNSGAVPSPSDLSLMSGGRIPVVTWASREYSTGRNYTWADITNGAVDSRIDANAERLKAVAPKKIFLSFDAEFDGNSHQVDGTGAQYAAAYRYIHDRLIAKGATNVIYVWTPTGYEGNWAKIPSYYPGDNYVDWMGYDPYNFYGCLGYTTWHDVKATFGPYYNWLDAGNITEAAKNKPRMLPEYGSRRDPNDVTRNGNWYRSLPSVLSTEFPKIKAVSFYNDIGVCDTRLDQADSQVASLDGFKEASQSNYAKQLQEYTPPPPENLPPEVSVSTPISGDTVHDAVMVTSSFSDDKSVINAQFYVDNTLVETKAVNKATGVVSFTWHSRSVANGSHVLRVRVIDGGSKTDDSSVTVTVNNTPYGLTGQYYDWMILQNLKLTRVDRGIYFDWGQNSPVSSMEPNRFGVRWTGKVIPARSERYTFYTQSDDGTRLWVNDQLIIDQWNDHGMKENAGSIDLNANTPYSIKLEYYDSYGRAAVSLLWSSSRTSKAVVPYQSLRAY